jgi:DNA polymerase-3 subunit alpha
MTYSEVDKVAKMIPNALEMTLEKSLKENPDLKTLVETDQRIKELFTLSMKLEGITRHSSIHAAGVVISKDSLLEHVPLMRGSDGEIVTQFTKDDVEKVGLVKFDFLGLTTLTLIQDAVRRIHERHPDFSIERIQLDDKETFELLAHGKTLGIFQLESRGMTDLIIKMQPENFEDLIALLALYRPGPINSGMVDDFIKRKKNPKEIVYELPELESVLKETYGVIVYQEQVMKIANILGGFSLGESDLLRRAMGKKKAEEMEKMKDKFVLGAKGLGFPVKKAEQVFELMAYFAGYGFNKSHSAAYALISYQTAYLKAHYPLELWAALLTNALDDTEKIGVFLVGAKDMGISVMPPDINESEFDFSLRSGSRILFGLGAVKNVGKQAVDAIIESRNESGPFKDFPDFIRRIEGRKVNRRVVEALIKAGGFRSLGIKRSVAMESLDPLLEWAEKAKQSKKSPMVSLFKEFTVDPETPPSLTDLPEWDERTLLKEEREALGFYLTSHPMAHYGDLIQKLSTKTIGEIESLPDGTIIGVFGVVSSLKIIRTKKGDRMAQCLLIDLEGSIEVVLFPDIFKGIESRLDADIPLLVSGSLERNDFGTKIRATRVDTLDDIMKNLYSAVLLKLQSDGLSTQDMMDMKGLVDRFPGKTPAIVEIDIMTEPASSCWLAGKKLQLNPTDEFIRSVNDRFGAGTATRLEVLPKELSDFMIQKRREEGRSFSPS